VPRDALGCTPQGYTAGRIAGLGMNAAELERNGALSDFAVADLNATPTLPYADNTFDVVTNAVSVDYLTRPLEVMKEVQRVLKPGGIALMSFSNRCFPTKAIAIWSARASASACACACA
jgi:ubiquinone/menaquinone biosynthesis C-methylase UbiE